MPDDVEAFPIQADSNIFVSEQVLGTRKVQTSEGVLEEEQRLVLTMQKVQSTANESMTKSGSEGRWMFPRGATRSGPRGAGHGR